MLSFRVFLADDGDVDHLRVAFCAAQNRVMVDDNNIHLKLLIAYAKKLSWSYTTASNGQEVVDRSTHGILAGDRLFHYILMDVFKPILDGFAATRPIRNIELAKSVRRRPIIVMTRLSSRAAHQVASEVDVFWTKPVQLERFKHLLLQGNNVVHKTSYHSAT